MGVVGGDGQRFCEATSLICNALKVQNKKINVTGHFIPEPCFSLSNLSMNGLINALLNICLSGL